MKATVKMWKHKLEHEIKDYAACKMSSESLEMLDRLGRNWMLYADICKRLDDYTDEPDVEEDTSQTPTYRLTDEEITHWNDNMLNADGSKGGHWTVEQTDELAKSLGVYFQHITPAEWNVTCNMMYSDYYMVAQNAGANTAEFYGNLAKAFLFDRDGPGPACKLCSYYHKIVVSRG